MDKKIVANAFYTLAILKIVIILSGLLSHFIPSDGILGFVWSGSIHILGWVREVTFVIAFIGMGKLLTRIMFE